eukprot:scaffold134683_cov23-Tisochrysis_lutea.AAC.1
MVRIAPRLTLNSPNVMRCFMHSLCSLHAPGQLRCTDAVRSAGAQAPKRMLHHETKALLKVAALQATACVM